MNSKVKESLLEATSIAKVSEAVRAVYNEMNNKKSEEDELELVEPWPCFKKRIDKMVLKFNVKEEANSSNNFSQKIIKKAIQNEQVLHTPAGLRLLLDVKTHEQLIGYCDILNIDFSDLNLIETLENVSPISQYCLLMAIGIYSQNTIEKLNRNIPVSLSEKSVSSEAIKRFKNKESFWEGILFTKRLCNGVDSKTPKKRGRRPKSMTARHYANDNYQSLEIIEEDFDLNKLLNEIEEDIKK